MLSTAAALAIVASVDAAPAQEAVGRSTLTQTIIGGPRVPGGFSLLRVGPGESYRVRQEGVGTAAAGREKRRVSLLYFGQMTDFQLADEESPARVEPTDPLGLLFTAAWRPQEALIPHMSDSEVRQMNQFVRSPVTQGNGSRAAMRFAITTGDSADNQERNEVEWTVRLLEGGTLTPNSGSPNPADYSGCPPGTPGTDEAARYTGTQDYDDYFESQQFYDPDRPLGPYASWPTFPGLMDRAQQTFVAEGLRVPSYVAFGNHDGLVQGNQAANASFEQIATGCVKAMVPSQAPSQPLSLFDLAQVLSAAGTDPTKVALVPPDPDRRFVNKAEYKALHFTGRQPDGHGFGFIDPAELQASRGAGGYYAWDVTPGLRFIALDTVSEGGVAGPSADGNLDEPQFRWLERELQRASARDQVIVLFGHHAIQSQTADVPDEAAPPCTSNDAHGHDVNPGCDVDPRDSRPIHLGEEVANLLLRYPHVVAFVAGHSHVNDVTPYTRAGGTGGFWMIRTAAEADWPHQARVLELMDNADGTLSVFGTLLDNAAPVNMPGSGTPASGFDANTLAAVGRTIGFNDPQKGGGSGEGNPQDRNVELLVRDPRKVGAVNRAAFAAQSQLRLTVSPRRLRAGRRTKFRFRVTRGLAAKASAVSSATVYFRGARIRTDRRGYATVVKRLPRAGRYSARATKTGLRSARTTVQAVRARRPRFTG